jgi:hypothetical protein
MQEMWLFGPLNTTADSKVQKQTDDDAKVVAELLAKLASTQGATATDEGAGDRMEVVSNL